MRVLLALGGNAMSGPGGSTKPEDQIAGVQQSMASVADLVAAGVEVVLTHGNGPQVGNLLVMNEVSAAVVPPLPLDWCGAQTQATLGFIMLNALEAAMAERGVTRPAVAVVTRTLVSVDDGGFSHPSKPIGRYLTREEAAVLIEHGQHFEDRGERGWRRVVASPEPLEILEVPVIAQLVRAGHVVIANGGGGIPVVRDSEGRLRGVEAVIDKDLGAAMLARNLGVDLLVIATDVEAAVLGFDRPDPQPLGTISVADLRGHAADGHFASGSMGPKVEAICRFVDATGNPGAITSLANIVATVRGEAGTFVIPAGYAASATPDGGGPVWR